MSTSRRAPSRLAFLLLAGCLAVAAGAQAATRFSVATGNWNTNGTWRTNSCAGGGAQGVPANGDTVTICAGTTVTLNANSANIASLTVQATGQLSIGNSGTARTLSVTSAPGTVSNSGTIQYATSANHTINISGTFTNAGTFTSAAVGGTKTLTVTGLITNSNLFRYAGTGVLTVNANGGISNSGTFDVATGSNLTHVLNVGGDITNTGTFNLATDANSLVNTTFDLNGNQTVSGGGATTQFNRITLNMGTTNANVMEIASGVNFSVNPAASTNFLTLTAGTFKFSTTGTITPFAADPGMNNRDGFWLNNSGATVTSGNFSWTVTGGLVRIDSGTMNLGSGGTADLVLGNNNATTLTINGGALNVTGGIWSSNNNGAGSYTQTGGAVTLGTVTPGDPTFFLGGSTSFTMNSSTSAATIILQNAASGSDFSACGPQTVTGGTVQFGNASYATPGAFFAVQDRCTTTAVNLWDMVIDSPVPAGANLPQVVLYSSGGTNVLDDLTIALTSGANAILSLNAGNPITVGGGNAAGHGNWVNNGTFCAGAYGAGTCTSAASTVTFAGTGTPSVGIGGATATTFSTLAVNKTGGATLPISTSPTVNAALTLTAGTVTTGTNKISMASAASFSGTGPLGSASLASSTNHVWGNLQWAFDATHLSHTYPAGDGVGNYTPVTIAFTALATPGNLTVSTASPATPAGDHPDTTAGRSGIDPTKSVKRYFTLTNPSVSGTYNATFTYLLADIPSGLTPSTVARGEACATSTTNPGGRNCNPWGLMASGTPTTTQASASGMLVVAGDRDADFAIGQTVTARFVRQKEFIYSRELY